ncbi:Arm DNA-binding domain-containing protein [Pseudomonas syringae]|uniref:Integrase protein n=1 Tax=Pseudomonas syringae pv. aptata TaxID=83167 RepID=A0A0Q0DIL7_PSEAP|nr:Arm DNA-binding domain-containing protein [Pseudomonas syringae]KPY97747.1 Integrase family protein [Pseudomonas syringae pv. aptata]MDP5167653.1 Arm DNA-binding domain-containing protein [Pseudomonas syringae pv. aptata str. DSM 50252]RMO57614.1 Integrase protein [Pseudomonas syringae pv. aptata]
MSRLAIPLSDLQCRTAKTRERAYKLFGGEGMYLFVKPSGVKTWRLKYTKPSGKEGTLIIGKIGQRAVVDSNPGSQNLKATLDRGGSPKVRLASGGSHGHSDVMDAYFYQCAHCGNSSPFIAALQQPIRLAISCANLRPSLSSGRRRAFLPLLQPRSYKALRHSPS